MSNTSNFIKAMHPSIIMTSAGKNKGWHLPGIDYLERLALVAPLSASSPVTDSTFNKGVYFTNLYDFPGGSSLTAANTLFEHVSGVSYDFGNNPDTEKGSYLIKVPDGAGIEDKSKFEVGRVDIDKPNPYTRLALFFCHTK